MLFQIFRLFHYSERIILSNLITISKQWRWDGSLWAGTSGSALFAKVLFIEVCGVEWVNIHSIYLLLHGTFFCQCLYGDFALNTFKKRRWSNQYVPQALWVISLTSGFQRFVDVFHKSCCLVNIGAHQCRVQSDLSLRSGDPERCSRGRSKGWTMSGTVNHRLPHSPQFYELGPLCTSTFSASDSERSLFLSRMFGDYHGSFDLVMLFSISRLLRRNTVLGQFRPNSLLYSWWCLEDESLKNQCPCPNVVIFLTIKRKNGRVVLVFWGFAHSLPGIHPVQASSVCQGRAQGQRNWLRPDLGDHLGYIPNIGWRWVTESRQHGHVRCVRLE